jgi:hypothetical protein
MASRTVNGDRARIGARTFRKDRWWLAPLVTVTVLGGFVLYGTWVAFANRDYFADPYLSPFYSPCLAASCQEPTWAIVGSWWPLSPALLVLPFPLGFRLTCYYYRKAYYRAFWQSPPACAVAEPHGKYTGETRFPLIFQNVHRYFFYAAAVISVLNTYDLVRAFRGGDGGFGIGVGTLVMLVNVVMLWTYTASCHSCRHLIGGRLRHFSAHPLRYKSWTFVSKLNTRHMELAWTTLGTLMVTDAYIALVASGTFGDPRIFN